MQYIPSLGTAIMHKLGPPRARAVSAGKSGYNVAAFMRGDGGSSSAPGGGSSKGAKAS